MANDATIRVRVTRETFDALSEQAAQAGVSLAEYLRPLLVSRAQKGLAPVWKKPDVSGNQQD